MQPIKSSNSSFAPYDREVEEIVLRAKQKASAVTNLTELDQKISEAQVLLHLHPYAFAPALDLLDI